MLIEPAETIDRLLALADDMGQHTDPATGNLGYGYIYYGLVRMARPEVVVCVGSYRGFAPVCLGLGLAHNRRGLCYFIDPGKVDDHWHDAKNLAALDRDFGLEGRVRHIAKTTRQAMAEGIIREEIDLLVIDGDHSYRGVKFDFDRLGARVRPGGTILLHDSVSVGEGFTKWEVKEFLAAEVKGKQCYEVLTLPFAAGLTLVRKLDPSELD